MDKYDLKQEKLEDEARETVMDAYREVQAFDDLEVFMELYITDEFVEELEALRIAAHNHGWSIDEVLGEI